MNTFFFAMTSLELKHRAPKVSSPATLVLHQHATAAAAAAAVQGYATVLSSEYRLHEP